MRLFAGLILLGALVGGCSYVNDKFGLADDNIIEETLEHQVKEKTGLDLDFTPRSPEDDARKF